MNKMSEKWDGLSSRERILVLLTLIVLPLLLIYVWLVEPAVITLKQQPSQFSSLETSISNQQKVLDLLKGKSPVDPNIAAREELKRLRVELTKANDDIRRAATNLVSPDQMLRMLRDVLDDGKDIFLVSAKSLAVETLQLGGGEANGENGQPSPSALIYTHPFEVELEGSYQGVYDYLQKIEQLEGVFFWDTLEYVVDKYPTAKVKIRVHTLSSEARWLGA